MLITLFHGNYPTCYQKQRSGKSTFSKYEKELLRSKLSSIFKRSGEALRLFSVAEGSLVFMGMPTLPSAIEERLN